MEPVELNRFWYCLPDNVTHIDAVYERPSKNSIVFFSGELKFLSNFPLHHNENILYINQIHEDLKS